ncbi:MAG TPA: hypothetical protein VI485_06815 [Vicinamibacterales bacterium]|nr:hypothetical protein [Vicinamibacterales bacterium]
MRLLFSVNNFGFLRNFEPALRALASRGHDVHLLAERKDSVGGTRTIDNLLRDHADRITYSYAPSRKDEFWQPLAVQVRLCLDYWRYLDARYDDSPSLRARAARQAPAFASRLPRLPVVGSRLAMATWARLLTTIERAMPAGAIVDRVLREQRPDLLLLTPLLYFGSQQVEYVRAAKAAGIPTVLGVGSWDHLTTKGLIHERPGRLVVWNEFQRTEAADIHGIAPERVSVTGAQAYDHWFQQRPSGTRADFSAKVGVPADRPLLLYLCSSPFITPYEVGFVRRWIAAVRGAEDPELRRAAILIRPHPQNAGQWADFDPSAFEAVGIWPRAGANPVDAEARADYYDSMFHSVAMVGINTSALIESGIVGRPVYTVLTSEFAGQQEGTLHFQHLKNANGGLLHVGASLDEHLAQVARAVRGDHDAAKSRAFVEAFVRPHGMDTPAADKFVEVIEAEAAAPRPAPVRASIAQGLLRQLLTPLALLARARAKAHKSRRRDGEALAGRPLRLLFVLASPEYLRYYDSTMRRLADRGHQVIVAVNSLQERKHARLELVDDERITVLGAMPERRDVWMPLATAVRGTMDFARYLHPRFADAPALRTRMYRKVLPRMLRPLNRIRSLSESSLSRLMRLLQSWERAVPVDPVIRQFIEAQRPDAVMVSPLIDAASDQVDVVRAAQAAGIPVVAAIASWDNLTNKGHMRVVPDLVTVWNEQQKREAVDYHGVPADRVAVTGAQLFDRWFDRVPSQSRAEFCRMVGLPDTRPFVLFTGSSVFIARSEVEVPFVRRWLEGLRASSDPALREAAVLVRPHPFNPDAWIVADFSDLGPVAIWPRQRYTPAEESARTSFFDSLHYSAAIVGINTSAMIEGAILRKPVLSLVTPEFAGTQEGTLHFRYLLPENGGFLRVAHTLQEHEEQLSSALRDPELVREQTDRFLGTFLRPHGLDVPCTPLLADAFERAARADRPAPGGESFGTRLLRVAVAPVAVVVRLFSSGDGSSLISRGAIRKAYPRSRRAARVTAKWIAKSPARTASALRTSGRATVRKTAKATSRVRRSAAAVVRWPAVRVMRLVRLARYNVATRLLGREAPKRGA